MGATREQPMALSRFQEWARAAKRELLTVYYVSRHARTPTVVKLMAAAVLLYALSPVDLIPDFVPVLGYVDDAVLLPVGIVLARRLTPDDVWDECRAEAAAHAGLRLPRNRVGAALVVFFWAALASLVAWRVWRR